MQPRPEHCLLCGEKIIQGIDTHVNGTHNMRYQEYCELFSQCDGTYSRLETDDKLILTITRIFDR